MPALVRSITFVGLVIALAGCGRAHGRDMDAGEEEGGTVVDAAGDASRDAAADGTVEDGGPVPSPCDRPVAEWVPETVELEGSWDAMELVRHPEGSWIIASPRAGGPMRALALDPAADARPVRWVALEGTEGELVRATDGDGFRIVTVGLQTLYVHDTAGRLMAREALARASEGRVSVALRDVRVGTIVSAPDGALAEVRDVAGGPPISSSMLDGWGEAAVSEGRGLFAFVASDGTASHYWGLDELGVIRATSLGAPLRWPSGDGSTFVALGRDGPVLRFPGGRIDALPVPAGATVYSAPTIAEGPLGTVVAWATDASVAITIDSGAWIAVAEADFRLRYAMADQAHARVGAFLHTSSTLRWAGLVCPR